MSHRISLNSSSPGALKTHLKPSPSPLSIFATRRSLCYRSVSLTLISLSSNRLYFRTSVYRRVVSVASSHEKSQVEETKESQEEWKRALASFKEQALKMHGVSQEAYDLYSKRATLVLQETSERLKIEADKAGKDLNVVLNEIKEESKVYLADAAANSPEPLKEIVEAYASATEEVSSFEQLQDFHVGIPYGAALVVGGFLYFMLTGSISAIRFGVILGGALLALSIYSLKSWKSGVSAPLAVKGQAAIAGILFLRELRMLFQRVSFSTLVSTLFSGAMVGTYAYIFVLAAKQSNPEHGKDTDGCSLR